MSSPSTKRKLENAESEQKSKKSKKDRPVIWIAYWKYFSDESWGDDGVSEEFFRERENAEAFIRDEIVNFCEMEFTGEEFEVFPERWRNRDGGIDSDVPFDVAVKALKTAGKLESGARHRWSIEQLVCKDEVDDKQEEGAGDRKEGDGAKEEEEGEGDDEEEEGEGEKSP